MKTLRIAAMIIIIIIAIAMTIGATGSTGKITGTIIDSVDKQPVVGARVVIEGTTIGAMVNALDGSYFIQNVPPGKYTLIGSCIGYANSEVTDVIVKTDSTTEVNFQLVSEAINTEDVIVCASAPEIDKYETSTVDRVGSRGSETQPPNDVNDIIKMQTGFISQGGAIHVRSQRDGEFAYIDDGVLIRDNLGSYDGSNIDKKETNPISRMTMNMSSSSVEQKANQYRWNTESYSCIVENEFKDALTNPLSTFSIDVDAASYSNIRRYINGGSLPPADAVRLEEMVNYFDYDYPMPGDDLPFSIITEISECPWNDDHRLIHIGLQGREIATEDLPPANLVFLIDVSGSMQPANKLPLLKSSFKLLVDKLRTEDRVAIVTYAGQAGLALESTPGDEKAKINAAIDALGAGGCTAGAKGIITAYKIAKQYYRKGGNNRVILATDGDFNIGVSSDGEMTELIESKRDEGIFLTVLGFGCGNYKDSKMEILADKGNGNYAYIDNINEARKVLVYDLRGTLFTIAKDVKIQIEFNPAKVKGYRLVGYENRLLAKEDFDDDTKDAGELGAGHTVTAMYEIIPAGSEEDIRLAGDLKYQVTELKPDAHNSHELMAVNLRYKEPDGKKSKLITQVALDQNIKLKKSSVNFRFAAAVAEWGMLLRDSQFRGNATFEQVLALAEKAKGDDLNGYRAEFIQLVKSSMALENTIAEN